MSLESRFRQLSRSLKLRRRGVAPHMRVFSHTSFDERMKLYDLAQSLPANAAVLEIGSHIGSSALFLCAGMQEKGGRLFCVDTWNNETMPDGEGDTYPEFAANTAPYTNMITPLRKWSSELTFDDIGTQLDLAFIDGDHSEAAVRTDLAIVSPWVKQTGIIAFHDVSRHFPGVNIVIGEALASGEWQLAGAVDDLAWIRRAS